MLDKWIEILALAREASREACEAFLQIDTKLQTLATERNAAEARVHRYAAMVQAAEEMVEFLRGEAIP